MVKAENNVAAQAGDEPMRARAKAAFAEFQNRRKEFGLPSLADKEGFMYGFAAAQVSPRATADVERDGAITLLRELLNMRDIAETYASGAMVSDEFQDFRDRVDNFLATTKPEARAMEQKTEASQAVDE